MDNINTRDLILEKAEELFLNKGFDKTTMADIQSSVNIARGTLYYHFESKEKIMDEIIERESKLMFEAARGIAGDRSKTALERFKMALMALGKNSHNNAFMEHLHSTDNALMHEKTNSKILHEVAPIFADIVKDGNEEGVFKCIYPLEAIEMLIVYSNYIFNYGFERLPYEIRAVKNRAFYHNLAILLGNEALLDEIIPL